MADAILARRANDGSSVTLHPQFGSSPGEWQPLAPVFEAVLPQWPKMRPFAATVSSFPVEPPPALNSSAYAQAVDEVMRLGSINSTQPHGRSRNSSIDSSLSMMHDRQTTFGFTW